MTKEEQRVMAKNNDLLAMVTYIERERGVEREIVLVAIEQAIQQAARRHPGVTNDLRVAIDRKTLTLHVYDTYVVSDEEKGVGFISVKKAQHFKPEVQEGDTIELEMPARNLGRIAAQMSRQMIMQKIREAERTHVFAEFRSRVGEIVSGTVVGANRQGTFVLVGRTEMLLPQKESLPNDDFKAGDTVKAIIHSVKGDANGPSVTLSRSSTEFVRALFRLEVSEIGEGIVEIMGLARDPGMRTKIAVRTLDEKIDPVGACVGIKGARVRNIVRELNGERLDIVRWHEDIRTYVKEALSPAKLLSVETDPEGRNSVLVTVSPKEYSLAIGRKGQNVRLTTKLTGWHIDVEKAMEMATFEMQKAEAIKNLADMFSVPTKVATQLVDAGFLTVEGIVECDEAGFVSATGIDEVTAQGIYAAAKAVAALTGAAAETVEEGSEG